MDQAILKALEDIKGGIATVNDRQDLFEKNLEELKNDQASMAELSKGVVERLDKVESTYGPRAPSVPGLEDEKNKFSFVRVVRALRAKDWSLAPFEHEVHKAVASDVDSAGGFLVPAQLIPDFIELLRGDLAVAQAGVTELTGLEGSPVEVPKQTGGSSAGWFAEAGPITDSTDPTFGNIKMVPHKCAGLAKVNNSLLMRAQLESVEGIVRADLARALAEIIDDAALRGTGANNQPQGLINHDSISSITVAFGTNGAAPTLALLQSVVNLVENNNALRGALAWIMSTWARQKIASLVDGNNRRLFFGSDEPQGQTIPPNNQILGFPLYTSTRLPNNLTKGSGTNLTELFFGNWADMILGYWGQLRIDASQEAGTAFTADQTWIRIIWEVDMGVRHIESFAYVADMIRV